MSGQRILICGARDWSDENLIEQKIRLHMPSVIIEGEANGADKISRNIGMKLNIPVIPFPARWKIYGKQAGPIRNLQMILEGKPDLVLAFHDNIDLSRGTKNMISQANKYNIKVELVTH